MGKRSINGSTRRQRIDRMKVWVPCVDEYRLITETQKEFLDVSEGPQGQDLLKYVCSWCGKIHEGQVTKS